MAATLSETRTLPSPRPLTLQRPCERVRWCGLYLSAGTVGQLLLDVHGQHLTAEGQALGLLYDLLVGRHRVVAHHHVALEGGERGGEEQTEVRTGRSTAAQTSRFGVWLFWVLMICF